MADLFMHTVLTPAVTAAQKHYSGRAYATPDTAPPRDAFTDAEADFISRRDFFYMATLSENGWPYIQHRGGPAGFLRVTGAHELMFADHGGNRQLLSAGNLAVNDRASLFLMDYVARERLKILGHVRVLDAREHPELIERTAPPGGHAARAERIFVMDVLSYDWNCPKFITPRFTAEEVQAAILPLQQRIAELESQLRRSTP